MSVIERSSSWASSSGATGSWATSRTASMARRCSTSGFISSFVGVDGERGDVSVGLTDPLDRDLAAAVGLVELDLALLEQLEHGEEAHDHLEALGEIGGQPG